MSKITNKQSLTSTSEKFLPFTRNYNEHTPWVRIIPSRLRVILFFGINDNWWEAYVEITMAWLKPPLDDEDKHWDIAWGLHFLLDVDDPRDKKQPIFGVPDEVLHQKLSKELMTTLFGENRELFAICSNGTTAVTMAISNSALPSHARLVSMGSYTGAYSFSETLSSVPVNIDDFFERDSLALERIVPLPYL